MDVVGRDRPAATDADAAVLRRRDETACIREGPRERTRGAPVPLGLPEPSMDQYDEPVGRPVGKVQVDHGIVMIGVAHGGVGQHGRHANARSRVLLMTKWEYLTAPVLVHSTKQILDNFGSEGWELVQMVPGMNPENLVAYFKRPVA